MARNRTPETHEKRRREHDKQTQRLEKIAKRNERNAAKREAKKAGVAVLSLPVLDPRQLDPPLPDVERP